MSIFFLGIIILWFLFGNFLYNSILNKKKIEQKISNIEKEKLMELKRTLNHNFKVLKEEKDFEEVYIKSKDSVKLHAYYIYANSLNWVILCHDYLEDAKSMSSIARYYLSKNFNILMIDARCHGKSDGKVITLGLLESMDVMQWLSWIVGRCPKAKIVLHGISMGAESILLNVSRLPSNITCIISESAYTSINDLLYFQLHIRFGILTGILLYSMYFITKIRTGISLKENEALAKMKKNRVPILFIHTKEDDWVPPIMMNTLYKDCFSKKQKFLLKGAHGLAHFTDEKYYKIVNQFLEIYMNRGIK